MDVDFAALARALDRPMGDPAREKAVRLIVRAVSLWDEPVFRVTPAGLERVETEWSPAWVERQLEVALTRAR